MLGKEGLVGPLMKKMCRGRLAEPAVGSARAASRAYQELSVRGRGQMYQLGIRNLRKVYRSAADLSRSRSRDDSTFKIEGLF